MGDNVGITLVKNGIADRLKAMLSNAQSSQATARVYPIYQALQTQRFMTENASEGEQWKPLEAYYAKYKQRRYGGARITRGKRKGDDWGTWPGKGTKMLIGTSTLAGAAIGPGAPFEGTQNHRALFSPYMMQISLEQSGENAEGKPFVYPQYVAKVRPFMGFSQASLSQMRNAVSQFIIGSGE